MRFFCLSIFVLGVFFESPCGASEMLAEITETEQKKVRAGHQVVITKNIEGQVWPELTVYQTLDATPAEAMAVFFDYNNARKFVPNVIKSEISNVLNPSVKDVDYGVKVPIFADEFYTARNSLSSLEGGGYVVTWKLLRAVQTKNSVGEFRVEKLGDRSLVRYRNLTTPSSAVARLLKGPAMRQMRHTATAILEEISRQKKQEPEALSSRVNTLQEALSEKPTD